MPNKEDVAAFKDFTPTELEKTPGSVATPQPIISNEPQKPIRPAAGAEERTKVTPYAKKLAAEHGIDLSVSHLDFIKYGKFDFLRMLLELALAEEFLPLIYVFPNPSPMLQNPQRCQREIENTQTFH